MTHLLLILFLCLLLLPKPPLFRIHYIIAKELTTKTSIFMFLIPHPWVKNLRKTLSPAGAMKPLSARVSPHRSRRQSPHPRGWTRQRRQTPQVAPVDVSTVDVFGGRVRWRALEIDHLRKMVESSWIDCINKLKLVLSIQNIPLYSLTLQIPTVFLKSKKLASCSCKAMCWRKLWKGTLTPQNSQGTSSWASPNSEPPTPSKNSQSVRCFTKRKRP